MTTRRAFLATALSALTIPKAKAKPMGWANTLTDPLVFPPGASGIGTIAIGTKVPIGLVNNSITSAIIFTMPDGQYFALTGDSTSEVIWFHGTDANDPAPVALFTMRQSQQNFFTDVVMQSTTDITLAGGWIKPKTNFRIFSTWLTMGAKFTNFGTGYNPVGFRVDADGWCNLEGLAYNNSGFAANAGDNVIVGGLPNPLSGFAQALPTLTGAVTPILLQISNIGVLNILGGSCPNAQNICLDGVRYYVGKTGT